MPLSNLIILITAIPLLVLLLNKKPIYACIMFIGIGYFRLQEAMPSLYPYRLLLVASILLFIIFLTSYASQKNLIYWSKPLKHLAIFFVIATIGIVGSVDRSRSISLWQSHLYISFLITLIFAWLYNKPDNFIKTFRYILLFGTIIAIISISNVSNEIGVIAKYGSRAGAGYIIVDGRPMGTMLTDPNDLALTLLFPINIALLLIFDSKQLQSSKILGLLCLPVLLWAFIGTESRGGFIGLTVSIMYLLNHKVKSKPLFILFTIIAISGVFAAMGLSSRPLYNPSGQLESSAEGRIEAWKAATRYAFQHPLTGIGLGNFMELHHRSSHSLWFSILSETGFVSFYFYVSAFALAFFQNNRLITKLKNQKDKKLLQLKSIALTTNLSLIGYCASASFLSRAYHFSTYIHLALAIACVHMINMRYQTDEDTTISTKDANKLSYSH